MFHIYQHTEGELKGKYDFAFISGNKFICGSSPQGYERKLGCYKALRTLMKSLGVSVLIFQDDSDQRPTTTYMLPLAGKPIPSAAKPKKPYIPNNK